MSGYLESQLVILCLSIIYAYGIFLPAASGQLNLGAAGFITLGAYASGWFNLSDGLGISMPLSIVLAMLFTGAVSFMIAFPILRTRGVYMVLATFAFAEVVSGLTINMEFLGAAAGMPVDDHAPVTILVIAAIAVILFCFYFMSTRLGLALRSIHDDESVSVLFGVNVRLAKVAAFTVGGMLMGLGGALYGHITIITSKPSRSTSSSASTYCCTSCLAVRKRPGGRWSAQFSLPLSQNSFETSQSRSGRPGSRIAGLSSSAALSSL